MSNTQDFDIYEYINKNETAKELFYSCYTMEDKRYYYSRREKVFERVRNDKVIFDLIKYDYPELIKIELVGKKEKEVLALPSTFLSTTFFLNTIDMVIDKIDLFQSEPLKLEKTDRILSITRNTYFLREPKHIPHITDEVKATILNDYKAHFPELDNILKWIVACRFTKDRRSSFLHLHLSAGFGKDFFQSIFKDLGLLVECRTDDFKSPSPLRAGEFRNSFVMLINEFTIFKKDYKNLIYNMILDSKNQLRTEVELFAKIFLSAEASNSFVDGVDKQITDRVNQIYKNTKLELKDRQVFKEYDSSIYYNVVYHYVYHFFKSTIQQYIDLGEINASKRASKVLREFHNIYKLDVELLDDKVKKVFWNTIFNIIDYIDDESHLNNIEREVAKNIIVKKDHTNQEVEAYYIKQFKKVFELIMKNEDEEFYKKARYKTSQIHTILGIKKEDIGKAHTVNKKSLKAFKFSKRDIIEFQDNKGNTKDFIYNPVIEDKPDDENQSLFDSVDDENIPF
jgi:hypothetical protein